MFAFLFPWLFFLLPLPWAVYKFWPKACFEPQSAMKVPFFLEIEALQAQHSFLPLKVNRKIIPWLIWILLVCAAAGPQWQGDPIPLAETGRNIFLAIDLSGSMQMKDMQIHDHKVDRLTVVKATAQDFIEHRKGDRIGLILFGSKAYLQTPLTFDYSTIKYMLKDATVGLAGEQTAIGDAIGLAIKRLRDVPIASRVLVLLTDGVNNAGTLDPIRAAELAAKENIKIHTIGFGTHKIQLPAFNLTNAEIDEETLQNISKITHGTFFRAANVEELQRVYQQIDYLEPVLEKKAFVRPVINYYYWPLALATVLSFLRVGRRIFILAE